MNLRTFPMAVILFLALVLALPQGASAEAVGHLTQVQGRVDLLKGGKLPATPVKVGDAVEPGDVLRAKSLSKAQITFVDQTTLTMSPESRIAIDEYMFDPAKGKRSVLLEVFHGAVLAVVSKIYQTEQPDFVIKTNTAIMGIRGTEVGIRLTANDTTILNFHGWTTVANVFPEVEDSISKKAKKIAFSFSFGPSAIDLKKDQGAVIAMLTPPKRFDLGPEDRKMFMHQLNIVARVGPRSAVSAGNPGASARASKAGSREGLGSAGETLGNNPGGSFTPDIHIYQQLTPVTQVAVAQPTIQTFSFTQQYSGTMGYQLIPNPSGTVGNYGNLPPGSVVSTMIGSVTTTPGYVTRVGVYPGTFTYGFNITASAPGPIFANNTGIFSVPNNNINNATYTVSGILGQPLTGNMTMTAYTSGNTYFTFSGAVTLWPNGNLNFSTTGTFSVGDTQGTTNGTLTVPPPPTSSTPTSLTQTSSTPPTLTQTSLTAPISTAQVSALKISTAPVLTEQVSALKISTAPVLTEPVSALKR